MNIGNRDDGGKEAKKGGGVKQGLNIQRGFGALPRQSRLRYIATGGKEADSACLRGG